MGSGLVYRRSSLACLDLRAYVDGVKRLSACAEASMCRKSGGVAGGEAQRPFSSEARIRKTMQKVLSRQL